MPVPEGCPDPIYDIMCHCWKPDPNNRPNLRYLLDFMEDYYVSLAVGAYREPWQWDRLTCNFGIIRTSKQVVYVTKWLVYKQVFAGWFSLM